MHLHRQPLIIPKHGPVPDTNHPPGLPVPEDPIRHGVFIVYYFYNVTIYLRAVMNTGASLGEALRFYFSLPLFYADWVPPSAGIALGIAIGLVLYFNRKRINREKAEPDEKPEESPDAVPEEEFIETTHCKYR